MALLSFLDREKSVAHPGFSRWLVPPAALAIHLSIGQAYAFSVFKIPLTQLIGVSKSIAGRLEAVPDRLDFFAGDRDARPLGRNFRQMARGRRARAKRCSRRRFASPGILYFLSSACSPTSSGCSTLATESSAESASGSATFRPVSTLIKWFPDRPGLATGMAIMGFGGGAMIGFAAGDQAHGVLPQLHATSASARRFWSWARSIYVHDVRRVYRSRAARRLEAGELDAARQDRRR